MPKRISILLSLLKTGSVMESCKTVEYLKQVAESGSMSNAARSAMNLIAHLRTHGHDVIYVSYLHEIVEHIYQESGLPLLDHLNDADCEVCAALAERIAG